MPGADVARHDDRALDVRGIDSEVGLQRLGEALHRELGGAVGGLRQVRADLRPEAVDAGGVDDVALVGLLQHRQEGARAVIDAEPADVEGALPLLAAVGKHAGAAADPGVVEQEMDPVHLVLLLDFVAEALHLGFVGHIDDVRCDTQALRQALLLAEPLGLGHACCRDVAQGHAATFGHELAHQFATHARAAAGDHSQPSCQILHLLPPVTTYRYEAGACEHGPAGAPRQAGRSPPTCANRPGRSPRRPRNRSRC